MTEDILIDEDITILQAMQKLDVTAKKILFVTRDKQLVAVVTDGDVRRWILANGSLEAPVRSAANYKPKYLYEGESEDALSFMKAQGIDSVPILNKQHEIVRVVFSNEGIRPIQTQELRDMPVVIMAGGKGTRLYPYTQVLPKPLIPIGEKTITEHIMSRFQKYGCNHFGMIVNHKKNFIKSYFLDNEKTFDVEFIEEEEFLGTAGGLKLLDHKYDRTFFMTNCDILIEEDYAEILEYHKKKNNIITMVCAEKNMVIPYGTVEVSEEGQATSLKEKPRLSFVANTGLYVIEPEFLDFIPEDTFVDITDVIQKCIDEGKKVGVYKISEDKWLDMGQLEELEKMKQKLNVN